ncbi:MAG TPA: PP2C family serine/threonine-protein phosphatase, partial [Vicinamibacteria bacterium]|nr:PP2C family serine/threonine-protein phosphatase [Vicinamibacteria bacterium]
MSAVELTEEQAERTGLREGGALQAAARTHRGAVRKDNQDAFLCAVEEGLFAVIDGMGGENGGQRAAALAREALLAEKEPVRGIMRANERVLEAAGADPSLDGMGCVASAMHVAEGMAHIGHVGDTRVYLAGSAGCEQLTCDHTLAASLQERLALSHRRAKGLEGRNQVTRDIGGKARKDTAWIDRLQAPLEKGSVLLLCSDGLYDTIGADDLFARLRRAHRDGTPPDRLVDELIELALERKASDNITAVVVRQVGDVPERERPAAPVRRARPNQAERLRLSLVPFLLGLAL